MKNHQLDADKTVFFYEHEFYPLSNFSAFNLIWDGRVFQTSEAAYHWEKFPDCKMLQAEILESKSAHAALKLAEQYRTARRKDWDKVKVGIMRSILRAKAEQHEYVRQKLLETGDRELVENSWRDSFWGSGEDGKGENWMGKLWMEIRAELRQAAPPRPLSGSVGLSGQEMYQDLTPPPLAELASAPPRAGWPASRAR